MSENVNTFCKAVNELFKFHSRRGGTPKVVFYETFNRAALIFLRSSLTTAFPIFVDHRCKSRLLQRRNACRWLVNDPAAKYWMVIAQILLRDIQLLVKTRRPPWLPLPNWGKRGLRKRLPVLLKSHQMNPVKTMSWKNYVLENYTRLYYERLNSNLGLMKVTHNLKTPTSAKPSGTLRSARESSPGGIVPVSLQKN